MGLTVVTVIELERGAMTEPTDPTLRRPLLCYTLTSYILILVITTIISLDCFLIFCQHSDLSSIRAGNQSSHCSFMTIISLAERDYKPFLSCISRVFKQLR